MISSFGILILWALERLTAKVRKDIKDLRKIIYEKDNSKELIWKSK